MVFHPGRKHKFRFQYIRLDYNQTATLKRDIVFNGKRYSVGLPVISQLDWQAYRFTYEYDFIAMSRGFGGVLLDLKQTHVRASLKSPLPQLDNFTDRSAPVPAIGGIARVYLVPSVSITGELSAIKVPDEHELRLQRTLHRARHLRHGEFQPQPRRPAGLPLAGRRRRDRQRLGVVHGEGTVLRDRRSLLTGRRARHAARSQTTTIGSVAARTCASLELRQ